MYINKNKYDLIYGTNENITVKIIEGDFIYYENNIDNINCLIKYVSKLNKPCQINIEIKKEV